MSSVDHATRTGRAAGLAVLLALSALVVAIVALTKTTQGTLGQFQVVTADAVVLTGADGMSTTIEGGKITIRNAEGHAVAQIGIAWDTGAGRVEIGAPDGTSVVLLTDDGSGGLVGAYDRRGKGRTLTPSW